MGGKKPTEIVELQVTTLSTIIDKFCPNGFPDYLDCDIEGMDYDVLESFDLYNDGPKVICVEVKKMQINKFDKMLKSKGYFRFCRIVCNNIYVRDEYSMKLLMFSQEMKESK